MSRTVLALCVLLLLNARAWGQPAGPAPDEPAIQVPGGVAALAEALGINEDLPRARLLPAAIRILWEAPDSVGPESNRRRARALEYLSGLDTLPAADAAADAADLPGLLPAPAWARVLREVGAAGASPFTSILGNRRAALLYLGLSSLDAPTREFLGSRPDLLEQVASDDRVGLFAAFGRSLRVRGDRVEVPGGAEAVPLWEEVAGERVADAPAFIRRVLDRDGGRLALLYDGIAHLDEPARRFALGLRFPPEKRRERFAAFYEAAGAALRTWQPRRRPFERVPFDAVHLLFSTRVEPDGQLAGPAWPPLWRAIFDPVVDARTALASLGNEELCDAAGMLELVSVADAAEREKRARIWLLAQRLFHRPPRGSGPELLVTLKGAARYPSLFVALERMGIEALPTYASAVRAADRLDAADRRLWLFQGALAIVERARAARSVDRDAAERLVRSLCALIPEKGDPAPAAVARWLERELLPAAAGSPLLPPDLAATDRPVETRLLATMAGSVNSPSNTALLALPPLEWEGLTYRIDPGASTLRRLVQVRARQGGRSLDAVLALSRLADDIAAAESPAAASAAAAKLAGAAAALRRQPGESQRWPAVAGDEPDLDRLAQRAADRARTLKAGDLEAAASLARPLQDAVDRLLVPVIGSIVYAPHLGEPDGPALLAGDPAAVHDFRLFAPGTELGRRTAWQQPAEVRDSRLAWGVSGSLLSLELALGRLALRRAYSETLPPPPTLSDAERQTFTEAAALAVPQDVTPAARDELLAAVERGRKRVEGLGASTDEIDRLAADVELDEWRTQALAWTVGHEPPRRLQFLSLAELARAGGLEPAAVPGLDAFGTSGYARDEALATVYPSHLPWTTLGGRRGVRAVASFVPDLAIALAESSARMGLPAALTPGLLLVATQRFIETVQTAHPDDWLTMAAHAQSVARADVEDYVAALTVSGPLVPERE